MTFILSQVSFKSQRDISFFFFSFFFFFVFLPFLGPLLWHIEVPGLGVESEL